MVCPGAVRSEITKNYFTGKKGEVHGEIRNEQMKRMSTKRCAELMAVGIANQLPEIWVALQPILFFQYINQYMPAIFSWWVGYY